MFMSVYIVKLRVKRERERKIGERESLYYYNIILYMGNLKRELII